MHEQDDGLTSSFFSAMMQEYGAALLTIGVGLWFLVRFLRTSGAASPLHSGQPASSANHKPADQQFFSFPFPP